MPGISFCDLDWGDFDNDGDLDLAIAGWNEDADTDVSKIYRNDGSDGMGGWMFTDIAASLTGVSRCSLAWADYDNDGDLDLAIVGGLGNGTSRIYRNDGAGTFTDLQIPIIGVWRGAVAWCDYDNDGDLDVALTGSTSTLLDLVSEIYRNDGDAIFTPVGQEMTGMYFASLSWGDYDNDGDPDLAVSGRIDGNARASKLLRNDGGDFFHEFDAPWPSAGSGSIAWGDHDSDGDLDFALCGSDGGSDFSEIYRNDGATPNTPPSPPNALSSSVDGGNLEFNWNAANDDETPAAGLSYNLRVGTTPGDDDILCAMADLSSGLRHIAATGNAQKQLSWVLNGLQPDTYYWSVQAIDNAYAGSPWAPEETVVVACESPILYVDAEAADGGDGCSWGSAYTELQDALAVATVGDEIRVAAGTYKADQDEAGNVTPGDREASFQLITGVEVYGGYAGLAQPEAPNERNIDAHETILSGDLNSDDGPNFENNGENSYHVVTGGGTDHTAIIDGFTISGGNANGNYWQHKFGGGMWIYQGSAMLLHCTVIGNSALNGGGYGVEESAPVIRGNFIANNAASSSGGGIYFRVGSSPIIDSNVIVHNHAGGTGQLGGGGICSWAGSGTILNNVIAHNTARIGGGLLSRYDHIVIANNTITNNFSSDLGGGIYVLNQGSAPQVMNCILWGNTAATGQQIHLWPGTGSAISVTFCNVQGGWPGTGNTDADPEFVDPTGPDGVAGTKDDDLHLLEASPCINSGDPGFAAQLGDTDLDGESRVQHCRVDMGADETPYIGEDCQPNGTADACDVSQRTSEDCNTNGIPDECDIEDCPPEDLSCQDCNTNGVPDGCDIGIAGGITEIIDATGDGTGNGLSIPFAITVDAAGNAYVAGSNSDNAFKIAPAASLDCNGNGIPDECETIGPILFVDADGTGANDGTSWTDAFNELQAAIALAECAPSSVNEIWVAEGRYTPDYDISTQTHTGNREATFQLVNSVSVYGRFAGIEDPSAFNLADRDFEANETILSGDLAPE